MKEDSPIVTLEGGASAGRLRRARSQQVLGGRIDIACDVSAKLLLQAAACNLALLMRSLHGAGKPRAAHDWVVEAVFAILAFLKATESSSEPQLDLSPHYAASNFLIHSHSGLLSAVRKTGGLDTGC